MLSAVKPVNDGVVQTTNVVHYTAPVNLYLSVYHIYLATITVVPKIGAATVQTSISTITQCTETMFMLLFAQSIVGPHKCAATIRGTASNQVNMVYIFYTSHS